METTKTMPLSKKITYFSILTAITVILQFIGGYLKIGAVNINLTLVPLVLCGMILGVWYSLALGAVIGLVILIQGITGLEPFTFALFNANPVLLSFICILKTTLAGGAGALVYKLLKFKNKYVATFISAGVVPVINTGVFVLGMLFFETPMRDFLAGLGLNTDGFSVVYVILVVVVTWNFFIEFAINLFLAPAIYRVIKIIGKN
ncbi:MAG: ECF transporter S component [Clostridia bacterium]|nr:ECF transporter S component [Clostridia bacterium]